MKIGILGSGDVGQALGKGFLNQGYDVMIGTRDVGKLGKWQKNNRKGNVGSFSDAAKFGEIVVLAVKGLAAKKVSEILEDFGFEIEDLGAVEVARAIEPLCILWCIPGFLRNEWNH